MLLKLKIDCCLLDFIGLAIGKDVAYNSKTCDICQRTNKSCVKYIAQMVKPPVIDQLFYRISIDIVVSNCLSLLKKVLYLFLTEVTSELFQIFLDYFGIDQLKCTVMHPQTNGIVERFFIDV